MAGMVYLVGAGPGDPALITVRGAECLARADVVIADRLASPRLLERARPGAEIVVRGPRTIDDQADLNALLVEKARAGLVVVRLKGGDPLLFGRGAEEIAALVAAGIAYQVVPGVTAAMAAPAYAGIPLTHRGVASAVVFATARESGDKGGARLDPRTLADGATTVVLYMSVTHLEETMARLRAAGRDPSTPVAVIGDGTLATQVVVTGSIADIAARAREAGIAPPALTIVGEVVKLRSSSAWFEARPRLLVLATDGEFDPPAGLELVRASPLVVEPIAMTLGDLGRFRWIAFTSRHAVAAFTDALAATDRDARALAHLRIAATGGATADALVRRFLRADVTANSGADLAAAILSDEPGRVLFPRAVAGRDELPDALAAAGIPVETIDAYATHVDASLVARLAAEHARAPFDAIALASPRGANALLDAIALDPDRTLVGAIGVTTGAALAARGMPHLVASRPSLAALVAELAAALARRPRMR